MGGEVFSNSSSPPIPPDECPKCGKKGIRGSKPHRCHWTTKPKSTSSDLRKLKLQTFGMIVPEKHEMIHKRGRYYRPELWDHTVD